MSSSLLAKQHQESNNNKSQTELEQNNNINKMMKKIQKYFLICEFCFWCASSYNINDDTSKSHDTVTTQYATCPVCGTDKAIESLPILFDESYKFDYKPITGVNHY